MLRRARWLQGAFLLVAAVVARADWPSLRGPAFDGSAAGSGSPEMPGRLDLVWKHAIGPGYSGVTVAAGRAVTAYSDGKVDVVAAWSTRDGRQLWRTPIGETYRGHDGSTDGPLGTATLTDSRVHLVGPFGDLVTLSIETGEILWRKHLEAEWGAVAPTYGFATIPLEVDGVLVVPVGTEEHSVVGLDPADGRQLWSLEGDRIDYSSPVVVGNGERREIVVAGSRELLGLDARGRRLWSHRHSEEPGFDPTFPQLQTVRDDLLLTFHDSAALYERTGEAERTAIAEVWRGPAFKKSVALPVAVGDHLYGFSGTFLTCVELATGRSVWKTRELRGRGIIRIDDRLVVLGTGGRLTVVQADPAGYREVATLMVSDHGGYTAPSFAGDRIYARNRTEIASVALVDAGATRAPAIEAPAPARGALTDWVRRIERATDPAAATAAFIAAQTSFPVVEPDWVHFVYAGKADAVTVIGQMNDAELGEPMTRVGRSDLFVRSYPAVEGGRWQYRFQVDYAEPGPDPRNPHRGSGGFEETSEVLMRGFVDPDFTTGTAGSTGTVETLRLESAAYASEIALPVYLPAGFDPQRPYPLIVMTNGEQWIADGEIVGILDRLFEARPRAAIVALVPLKNWVGGSWGGKAVTLLGEELLPALEAKYRIASGVGHRSLWTVEDKAAVGMTLAVQAPEVFGRFAFQSPKLYVARLPDLEPLTERPVAFRISWSRFAPRSPESGTDDRAEAERLFEWIRAAGLRIEGGEFVAGPGYRTWRMEAAAILDFLLDAPPAPS